MVVRALVVLMMFFGTSHRLFTELVHPGFVDFLIIEFNLTKPLNAIEFGIFSLWLFYPVFNFFRLAFKYPPEIN